MQYRRCSALFIMGFVEICCYSVVYVELWMLFVVIVRNRRIVCLESKNHLKKIKCFDVVFLGLRLICFSLFPDACISTWYLYVASMALADLRIRGVIDIFCGSEFIRAFYPSQYTPFLDFTVAFSTCSMMKTCTKLSL